jgi:cytochrome c peroxidase
MIANVSKAALPAAVLLCATGCVPSMWPWQQSATDTQLRQLLNTHTIKPIEKPLTDAAQVELGQALFFDKLLSGNRDVSCATCHAPGAATGDALSLSKGTGGAGFGATRVAATDGEGRPILIPRNAPELFNRAQFHTMFWDGRVRQLADGTMVTPAGDATPTGLNSSLAAQAIFPVTSRDEMRGRLGENDIAELDDKDFTGMWTLLLDRLRAVPEYEALFAAAYPGVAPADWTFAHVGNAIAAFEIEHWTLDDSPFDWYLAGDDSALSDSAKRGALLFYGDANCVQCHSGSLLTDQAFHNRVVPQCGPGKGDGDTGMWDFGRGRETGVETDMFAFRTPPLRNVAATGPWMHDGAFATLEGAVRHCLDPMTSVQDYDMLQLTAEMEDVARPEQLDAIIAAADPNELAPVALTDSEVGDVLAFLQSLSSPRLGELVLRDTPERVPSGLPVAD